MRRGNLIWGIIIVLVGVLLLLDNLGFLPANINVWTLIWPVVLILLGIWFLVGPRLYGRRSMEARELSIPLETARRADLTVEHGAGRLDISAGGGMEFLSGSFGGDVESDVRRNGDQLSVRLRPPMDMAFVGFWAYNPHGYDWRFRVSPDVDLNLIMKTGAGESTVDLSGMRVTNLRLETGASSTSLTLPANAGQTRVEVHAGAARVDIRLPMGVAARIHTETGISSVDVDTLRFPRSGNDYASPDYETAANRAEIRVEAGAGSISIR